MGAKQRRNQSKRKNWRAQTLKWQPRQKYHPKREKNWNQLIPKLKKISPNPKNGWANQKRGAQKNKIILSAEGISPEIKIINQEREKKKEKKIIMRKPSKMYRQIGEENGNLSGLYPPDFSSASENYLLILFEWLVWVQNLI